MKRLILGLLCVNFSISAAEIEYRRAQVSDILSVLDLMKESASYNDRVMTVPEACRESFVKGMIDKNILFVAVSDGRVVGTKKFFIAEGADKKDILENLVRSEGQKAGKASLRVRIGNEGKISSSIDTPESHDLGVCLYSGFGYTREEFRRQDVYKKLSEFAYAETIEQVKTALRTSGGRKITFMFLLTQPNSGLHREDDLHPTVGYDRTPSMARGFQKFIKQYFTKNADVIDIELSRYNSFLPAFDPDSKTCGNPLPDEKSYPMYGFILTYELKDCLV